MGKETINWIIRIAVMLIIAFILIAIGHRIGMDRAARKHRPVMISYQAQIDSLRFRLDTALAHIDFEYVPKDRVIVQTKYKYIIQKIENEKHKYFALDTSGRVAYFRQRVRARTGK